MILKYHLLFGFLALFCCCTSESISSEEQQVEVISTGKFILHEDFPSEFVSSRNIEVWLPKQYDSVDAVPVLYMFDGQNIFHAFEGWGGETNPGWRVDDVLDSLITIRSIPPIMVVGVFNAQNKRGAEYMPAKPKAELSKRIAAATDEWYKSFQEQPPESDEQLSFVVNELKPFIDSTYKTKADQNNTYVAGSSMGGLISAYAICEYPEVFGGAACFSTHWIPFNGIFLEYIKTNLPDPENHKIYFDYGTETLDAEYAPFQEIADSAMIARGFKSDGNWITMKFEGAKHHEEDWHKRFHIPMEFLLK